MNGQYIMTWLDEASRFSQPGPGVTRMFLTREHRQLLDWLGEKAAGLGLQHWIDDSGNCVIRRPADAADARTLILGSHQDTVREGGKYDGMLGVALPLAALADLPSLPFHVDVVAFGDEEGTRFNSTLVGSSALAGCFDSGMLERSDESGVTMQQALRDFGLRPERIPSLARNRDAVLGFVEVHIEQGPVLERHGLPVGVVTAMTGIERHLVTVHGKAGHAGTTPMDLRQDALVKAAQIVTFVDRLCRCTDGLVGVVGELHVEPNAVNVIPARVSLTVELRSPRTDIRCKARTSFQTFVDDLSGVEHDCSYAKDGVDLDPDLMARLATAIEHEDLEVKYLYSGAGHDGLAMSNLTRCAMLFLRCKDGLSHHPYEAITAQDCDIALRVLRRFVVELADDEAR